MTDPAGGIEGSTIVTAMYATAPISACASAVPVIAGTRRRWKCRSAFISRAIPSGMRTRTWGVRRSSRRSASAASRWPPLLPWPASSVPDRRAKLPTTRTRCTRSPRAWPRMDDSGPGLRRRSDRHRPPKVLPYRQDALHQHRHRPQGARRRSGRCRNRARAARLFRAGAGRSCGKPRRVLNVDERADMTSCLRVNRDTQNAQ